MRLHRLRFVFVLFLIPGFAMLSAQPGTVTSHTENSQLVKDLSGYTWKMKQMHPGQGVREGLHQLPPADIETLVWNAAHVPGDVYTDLWKAGVIEDPYFGRNTVKAQWVSYEEWWYAKQFSVTEDLAGRVVRIDFEGVDYSCDVWLNGTYLGNHEGAFAPFSFDVTDAIRSSDHAIRSQNILLVRLNPPPQVNSKVAGKKTPWFGDYWRDLVPFGITGRVKMVATGTTRVNNLYTHSTLHEDGSATVHVEVTVENTTEASREITVGGSLDGHNFETDPLSFSSTQLVEPGLHVFKQDVNVEKPALWWPWDLGEPNLYNATVVVSENNRDLDLAETTFGIREIKMEWNPGFTSDQVSFPRTLKLNGKTHFIRSACWGGPPDIFVGRTSVKEYETLIRMAKEANMNNIRIFGWHPPEIPEFYQLCNEAGLTVWQDVIPLGTGNMPKEKAYLDDVINEAVEVIKVRRNHPCLILIEGGEEAFLRAQDPQFTKDFLVRLGDSLQAYANLPYVPDSPLTNGPALEVGYKPNESIHALAYFYSMGNWLMEDWLKDIGHNYPIVPELAITSVPSVESLRKFIPEKELWPPGLSWGHHWADFYRLKMQNFDTFGETRTGSLEEFVNATQDAQGTIFQLSIEHFRRGKPRLSAVALCHYITYWPDMKWGFVDNYQQPKRSYDFVKRAYQPLLVNLQFDKRRWKNDESFEGEIWLVNDLYETFEKCEVDLKISDDEGVVLAEKSFKVKEIAENSAVKLEEISEEVLSSVEKYFYVELTLSDREENILSSNEYMLLIGDHESASATMKEMGKDIRDADGQFQYGNYYMFYPALNGERDINWESETEVPTVKGFK